MIMGHTVSKDCYYNDSFSLVWDHHNKCYSLTVYYEDGEEVQTIIYEGMLPDLISLGISLGKDFT